MTSSAPRRIMTAAAAIFLAVLALLSAVNSTTSQQLVDPDSVDTGGPLVAPGEAPDLILIYTGGVVGYVEPCGCPKNPAGGLARRAGYLRLLKEAYPRSVVTFLESGDFSGDPDVVGDYKTGNLIEGMSMLDYSALNVGERELARGIPEFRESVKDTGLAFTSASFVTRDKGETVFAPFITRPYTLESGKQVTLGYVGLTTLNSAFARKDEQDRVVIINDPVDALRSVMPLLRPRVDMVVVLANLSLRDMARVLGAVQGVDLVLASYGTRLSPSGSLEEIAGVPVFYSGDQGKRMGEIRLRFPDGQFPLVASNHVWLTRRYPTEPQLQGLIDTTIARVNDINRQNAERLTGSPRPASTPAGVPYVTAGQCRTCHDVEYSIYEHSAHAHAFETLVNANQDYNAECVQCHVTGFKEALGFVNARSTPEMKNVQCEACHGNAARHILATDQPYGDVPPRACFACHTKENSPDFIFFKYWDMIKH